MKLKDIQAKEVPRVRALCAKCGESVSKDGECPHCHWTAPLPTAVTAKSLLEKERAK